MHKHDEQRRSPDVLRRITSLAALVSDPDNVNWATLRNAWLELSLETKGSPVENSVAQLATFIQLEDAKGFIEILVEMTEASTVVNGGQEHLD